MCIQITQQSQTETSISEPQAACDDVVPSTSTSGCKPLAKRFKLLARDCDMKAVTNSSTSGSIAPLDKELSDYMNDIKAGLALCDDNGCGLSFWVKNESRYPLLSPLAEDLIAAPASEAYAERVFSLCGDMCARKRNRASTNLEKRCFLKMNKKYVV